MKITALGANAAFSTGTFKNVIELDDIKDYITKSYEITGSDTQYYTSNPEAEFSKPDLDDLIKQVSSKVKKAYFPKWQSNFLIEFKKPGKIKKDIYRLVLDFGGDIRHSLAQQGLTFNDIDGYYCSHPHSDHIGGIEGIALSTIFNPFWNDTKKKWHSTLLGKVIPISELLMEQGHNAIPNDAKPDLYAHLNVIDELWQAAEPGLMTLQGIRKVELSTYFNVIPLHDNEEIKITDGDVIWTVYCVISTHVMSGAAMMPSYGLMFEGSHGKKIYIPTDSMFMSPHQIITYYKRADIIYQDCETSPFKSGVHPHLDDLKNKLEPDIKKKLLLYHYQEDPIIEEDEFLGIIRTGDSQEY